MTNWAGTTLTYDANGNLTGDGSLTYGWDSRGRLASLSGTATASFVYDAIGRRTVKTVNGTATNFLYDGPNAVQELAGATPTANLLSGLRIDEIYSRIDGLGARSFITDALGSTVALTDTSGVLKTSYAYEPYGKSSATGETSSNSAQYAGRENDGTGLFYYRARYYQPVFGRFLSEDPIGLNGGANLYAYVKGNPISNVDPSGLFGIAGAAIGVVSGGTAGYVSGGGWGLVAGAVVGGVVGVAAPYASEAAGAAVGSGVAGMLTVTATNGAMGAIAGAASTMLGNALAHKCIGDGVGWGAAIGGLAPMMSAEAFLVGAGGEAAFGTAISNAFTALTGAFGVVGAATDPGAAHGFRSR